MPYMAVCCGVKQGGEYGDRLGGGGGTVINDQLGVGVWPTLSRVSAQSLVLVLVTALFFLRPRVLTQC